MVAPPVSSCYVSSMTQFIIVDRRASQPLFVSAHSLVGGYTVPWTYNRGAARKFQTEASAKRWLEEYYEATGIKSKDDVVIPEDGKILHRPRRTVHVDAPENMSTKKIRVRKKPAAPPSSKGQPALPVR